MRRSKLWMLLISLGIFFLSVFGVTMAVYNHSMQLDNKFDAADAKVYINEKFDAYDQWIPGEEKEKRVWFGNDGDVDTVLRVKFSPELKLNDGTPVTDQAVLDSFKLNFSSGFSDDWTEGDDGWYYYNRVLKSSEKTDCTLESVTVSNLIGNDGRGSNTDYSSAVFTVNVESEMIQALQAEDIAAEKGWTMIPEVSEGSVSWMAI